jgi:hypothetical protein
MILTRSGFNPLLSVSTEYVDFDRLARSPTKLFITLITATNVRTDRGRIFRNSEITVDLLLASACLRTMFEQSKSMVSRIGMEICWKPDHHTADPRKRCT